MIKAIRFSTAVALVLALPAAAAAQPTANGSSCPPGSWFCAQAPDEQSTPAGKPVPLQPLPDPDDTSPTDDAPPPPPPPRHPHRRPPPPPVVVEEPPPPPLDAARPDMPYEYAPRREPISRPREWGLALRVEGAMFGRGAGNAGMGGGGGGLRFKPSRRFGIEADLDLLGGTDYQGNSRNETAFGFNGLLYLNPQSRAQLYLLVGFGWSGAHVTCDSCVTGLNAGLDRHYTYFGGQAGGGLELRLTRALALNVDVRGFIRTRIDDQAQSQPEFVDASGRSTNSSGGALVTGGMVIYF